MNNLRDDVDLSRSSPAEFSRRLFSGLPTRYNALANLLSMGQDPRWRAAMVSHIPADQRGVILDVACGPCAVTLALAERTSASLISLDLSPDMLGEGSRNVMRANLASRVALTLGRGEQLPFADNSFDALTFTYLLRYVSDPQAALVELARVLKPGGVIANLEFAVPPRAWWRAAWWCYTRGVLPVAGFLSGGRAWFEVGRFLGPSISQHYEKYPLDWTVRAWQNAGLTNVDFRRMSLGGGVVFWGEKAVT